MAKPKIRFKGFTEDWEERKLGELADYKKGPFGSALKKDIFVPKSDTTVKVYEQQNAINKDWHLERYFITKEYAKKLSGFRVKGGDIIVSCAGTIGETYELPMDAEPGIINQALMKIEVKESIVNKKMFNTLFTNMINDFTKVHSNGSAIKNIPPFSDLKPKGVLIPEMNEQNKIATYFVSLDHLITLHQQKCEETKTLKKYMLQKMLVQNGQTVPQIRFSGFTEDWEERKLGEVFSERLERANGDEELLSVTIGNGVIRQVDSDKRNIASEDKSNYKIVCKGDVPYNSMRMWQGAVGNSEYDGIVSPAYTVLVPSKDANGKFFMELFKKETTLKVFQRWSQGLTSDTWNLKYPILSTIEFFMPSIAEQQKIGAYFSSLDHLITLHQQKCDTLKNIKKYMLQNMFV